MTTSSFLFQDRSWRTIVIPWGTDFNSRLRSAVADAPPEIANPAIPSELDRYRITNDSSLSLLDSRQVEPNDLLPFHICATAFHSWARAEEELLDYQRQWIKHPETTLEYRLVDNYLYALTCVYQFNLANLSLVDESSDFSMLQGALSSIQMVRGVLQQAIPFEASLIDDLNGFPCPTEQVRNALERPTATHAAKTSIPPLSPFARLHQSAYPLHRPAFPLDG
ncbi:hypothetical protein [Pseudarthrobacter niigatensis]|uniref:Uncharacterized protein n=1 Tax=Pseudarthrobacter niigatensis TaxID=369935 RepID=A0AAJ1WE93_9MICC|nr:hypothetical protein [Pseudarthrobacter niigatensis]MDQ0144747.1 hypothetical protein [Pseudarthrobacter niigatensis]MDQ0265394.1 hypothetical protein [Pseudarthrobacter niigatensis]